jgi:hypothetical protein
MMSALILTVVWMVCGSGLPQARAATWPLDGASTAPVHADVGIAPAADIGSIYTAEHQRDPFARWGSGHGRARAFSPQDFSIHKLSLRGILRGAGTNFALFVDNDAGWGFLLRKGRLYDPKKKALPGVAGFIKGKTVTLTAPEGDVQVFQVGQEEQD